MSIRFAAAGTGVSPAVARVLRCPAARPAANDGDEGLLQDYLLQSALRHFARHGLGAARQAGNIALRAHREGDSIGFQHWLAICRKLDRRLADRLSIQTPRYDP